jgi:hypothetical protein
MTTDGEFVLDGGGDDYNKRNEQGIIVRKGLNDL